MYMYSITFSKLDGFFSVGKGLFEFTSMEKENVEIREFRKTMADVCARAVKERNETAARRALYRFPPDVEASEELPAHVRANLDQNSTYLFMVYLKQSQRFTFSISVEATPLSLVALTLQKKARTTQNKSREHTDDYVLKVIIDEKILFSRWNCSYLGCWKTRLSSC